MKNNYLLQIIVAATLLIGTCSFILLHGIGENEIENNQVSVSGKKLDLHFAGLEESGPGNWLNIPTATHFKSVIFLSDVHLNDATVNTHEKVILKLSTYTSGNEFKKGMYKVVSQGYKIQKEEESIVKGEVLYLEGYNESLKVVGGTVQYDGDYPESSISFRLTLENGKIIEGNYLEGLEDFKYLF